MKISTYTHKMKRTGQRCFPAAWWPTADAHAGNKEKEYPLMMFESGQCNRVNAKNLTRIMGAA